MNTRLIFRLLGWIAILVAAAMCFSLPWAFPAFGETDTFELRGFLGMLGAICISAIIGVGMIYLGRGSSKQRLLRKEAIAVVGLSWILASLLGALPFWFSETIRELDDEGRPVYMTFFDGVFESASGFSGTGASVLTELDDPAFVPRTVLFWRSETHFLGGLGIMVLFVAVLGMGSAGKALMLTEVPGPTQESTHERTQRAAWTFAMIFVGLNAVLTVLLVLEGMSVYDALCHAFGTIATGGFSTHNKSVGHFDSPVIDATIVIFMFLGCTNFALLYHVLLGQPGKLWRDVEFRVYLAITIIGSAIVVAAGLLYADFDTPFAGLRYGVFQAVSMLTNTGFGTHDFDAWNPLGRGTLLLLMYIGGCAGSTSCAVKVIRYIFLFKILFLEIERSFRPNVVRHIRIGGRPVEDPDLRKDVVVYFCLILVFSVVAWFGLLVCEPNSSWTNAGLDPANKLIDCAGAVAATINGVGPGLGLVGPTSNYSMLSGASKLILTGLMLLGRLEIFALVALFLPRFWRNQ
ncbi:TrkH family potassium uptake protein [Thermostilla marina]